MREKIIGFGILHAAAQHRIMHFLGKQTPHVIPASSDSSAITLNTNGGRGVHIELVFSESRKKIGLADIEIANQHDFE